MPTSSTPTPQPLVVTPPPKKPAKKKATKKKTKKKSAKTTPLKATATTPEPRPLTLSDIGLARIATFKRDVTAQYSTSDMLGALIYQCMFETGAYSMDTILAELIPSNRSLVELYFAPVFGSPTSPRPVEDMHADPILHILDSFFQACNADSLERFDLTNVHVRARVIFRLIAGPVFKMNAPA